MIKSLSKLFSGNAAVQAISLLLMPIVTRIYAPSELGTYQFITTTALIISPFANLSLAEAIIKEKDDIANKDILLTACLVSFTASVLFSALFQGLIFFDLNGMSLNFGHSLLFFSLLFTSALMSYARACYVRDRCYGKFALQGVYSSLAGNSVKIISGLLYPISFSLILGLVAGNVAAIYYTIYNYGVNKIINIKLPTIRKVFYTLNRLKGFTVHFTFSQFISILISWHLVFFAPFIASPSEVGVLSLALMVTKTPSFPFLSSITKYAYSESAQSYYLNNAIAPKLIKLGLLGLAGTLAVMLIFVLWGEMLFVTVFGADWADASAYAVLLTLPLISSFSLQPSNITLANLFELQTCLFATDIVVSFFLVILCYFAILDDWSIYKYVMANSVTISLSHVCKFGLVVMGSKEKSISN